MEYQYRYGSVAERRKPPLVQRSAEGAEEQGPIEQDSCHTENRCKGNEDVIVREVKSAGKGLVAVEMGTMVKDTLNEVLRKRLDKTQSVV